jgi:hypothetical protein
MQLREYAIALTVVAGADETAGSVERWGSGHARDSRDTTGLGTLCDITLTVETCELDEMKTAYDRILLNDVRFRAVLE